VKRDGVTTQVTHKELYTLKDWQEENTEVEAGDIVPSSASRILKSATPLLTSKIRRTETIAIDEPTMSMLFTINNSPFLVRKESL
jgi:GTP-binding protein